MSQFLDPLASTCPAVGYQTADVCVAVTVTPSADTGTPVTQCCGDPVVTPGRNTCSGTKKGACVFTISQRVCVAVPVTFGATATPGDTYVECVAASADDLCSDCGAPDAG